MIGMTPGAAKYLRRDEAEDLKASLFDRAGRAVDNSTMRE
jgi:hypothetical protein